MKLEKTLELADPNEMISVQERNRDFLKRYRWFCKQHGHGGPWQENRSYAYSGAVDHQDLHPEVYGVEEDNVVGDQGA